MVNLIKQRICSIQRHRLFFFMFSKTTIFGVFVAVDIKIMLFWDVVTSSCEESDQHFGGSCCLYFRVQKVHELVP
jgi:hypothetical protein